MQSFAARVLEKTRQLDNPTVLGLDPDFGLMPIDFLEETASSLGLHWPEAAKEARFVEEAIYRYNAALIAATSDLIAAVKPQLAYYEMGGEAGLRALKRTIDCAKKAGQLVILDGKRNDIGKTSTAYAEAWLTGDMGGDALTINGYLGIDGVKPFLDLCTKEGKGVFCLVRTSNASAGDLQDLKLEDGRRVYEAMADLLEQWSQDLFDENCPYSPVGAVVGATWPEQAKTLRQRMPHALILVPGYGAQGATADDCMASFDARGEGALVNASRSLMYAWKKAEQKDFAEACRQEALKMRDALRQARDKHLAQ